MPVAGTIPFKPKIHFVALVGVFLDHDLFPFWVPHYLSLQCDTYTVYLHECKNDALNDWAISYLRGHGFTVYPVHESAIRECKVMPNCPDHVRRTFFEAFAASLSASDFIITADGDEIQEWPELPKKSLMRGIELVFGALLDRFDETLHAPNLGLSLDENYPLHHENLTALWREEPLNMRKVCMAPADYPLEYSGSHETKPENSAYRRLFSSGPLIVHHYRWREYALERVQGRSYWPDTQIQKVRKFFQVEV